MNDDVIYILKYFSITPYIYQKTISLNELCDKQGWNLWTDFWDNENMSELTFLNCLEEDFPRT